MRTSTFLAVVLVGLWGWLASASAVESVPDADFSLQGEYAGRLEVPGIGSEWVGLQVIALGEGNFEAVRLRGGLPGAGWDRLQKEKLSGKRSESVLTLKGPAQKIEIVADVATVYDPQGNRLGTLAKTVRVSPTMGAAPAAGAVVLFDGSSVEQFVAAKLSPEGWLKAGALMKTPVQDFRMHLEFRTPYMPQARGQGRGNSGVYLQQRYELQILDSFGLAGIENECGGIYRQQRPEVNMCLPPLSWQTYDITFYAPKFAADGVTKIANARLTVLHNGIAIHENREVFAKTGAGKPEGAQPLAINLQDHNDPVVFRNIWLVSLDSQFTVRGQNEAECCPGEQRSCGLRGYCRVPFSQRHCR